LRLPLCLFEPWHDPDEKQDGQHNAARQQERDEPSSHGFQPLRGVWGSASS
jgi:hypothetical protein